MNDFIDNIPMQIDFCGLSDSLLLGFIAAQASTPNMIFADQTSKLPAENHMLGVQFFFGRSSCSSRTVHGFKGCMHDHRGMHARFGFGRIDGCLL